MENLKKIFARNLLQLRCDKQITQYELGIAINYSDKAVSRWERGEAIPDAYVLLQLADYFNVSVDFLLKDHDNDQLTPQVKTDTKINFKVIMGIVVVGILSIALLAYIVLHILSINEWMIFVYALPVSLIATLILNSIWNARKYNFYIISALVWSVIIAIYLSFLAYMNNNWWIILLIGIPAQIITVLCFNIKIKKAIKKFKRGRTKSLSNSEN